MTSTHRERLHGERPWIWCGPIGGSRDPATSAAVSLAALHWQRGLIQALRDVGINVRIVGYVPERAWPGGELLVGGRKGDLLGLDCEHGSKYLNIAGLRELGLAAAQIRAIVRSTEPASQPLLLTYNVRPSAAATAMLLRAVRGVSWLPVVADRPESGWRSAAHDVAIRAAKGCVFLAHAAYLEWTAGPKLHLDGGVWEVARPATERPVARALLYAGSLTRFAGLELLLRGFGMVRDRDCQLWICGKGDDGAVREAAAKDNRIRYFGVVPEPKLRELSAEALGFVNPRPPDLSTSDHNFPSKILDYLGYGKPVISTWTGGLAPEYRGVLQVVDGRAEAFAAGIEEVLRLGERELSAIRERIRAFAAERTWAAQARRLVEFAGTLRA